MMGAQFTLAESYATANREAEADSFKDRLFTIATHGVLSMAVALGHELGLFRALAQAGSAGGPADAEAVAKVAAAEMKPRYVQEWLSCMACGGIIECDESGKGFWIAEERVPILVGESPKEHHHNAKASAPGEAPRSAPDSSLLVHTFLPSFGGETFGRVADVFHAEGPPGIDYSAYAGFYTHMNEFSRALHSKHLCGDLLEMMGMREALSKGLTVMDVGCGQGFHMMQLAKHFPKSNFTGVDISASAIRNASAEAAQARLRNVRFVEHDAAHLPAEWSNHYDLIFIFDACHDQCRPDLTLREIYRCLKPGGLFTMVEIGGTGNCHTDKHGKLGADVPTYFYAASLFHCLPVGSNRADALQLGTMWGVVRGRRMIEEAGFKTGQVSVEPIPFYPLNVLYQAVKGKDDDAARLP